MTKSHSSASDWFHIRNRLAELIQPDDASAVDLLAGEFPYVKANEQLWLDCIYAEFCLREERGQTPSPNSYISRFPAHADELRKLFEIHAELNRPSLLAEPFRNGSDPAGLDESEVTTPPTVCASQTTNPAQDVAFIPSPPESLIGDYQVLSKIASGGMGVVYKAYHPQLDRLVAIKLIKSGGLADGDPARRFELEARAAARLDHPGIVPVYEIGRHEGRLFLVMPFVDGESLWQRVQRSPLEPQAAARLLQQVAEAVQYAHHQGIVHRDLKPHNVLLTKADQPRVADFGLAKHQGQDSSLTDTGDVLGTPSYMPPEQAAGKIAQIGPQSDVYSLGATLYAVLTGRPPFHAASTVDTLFQVLHQEPIPLRVLNPTMPVDLETICLKALQKEPSRRYASTQAFADDLVRFQNGGPILARPVGRFERAWRWCRKNLVVAGLSTTAACLLITVAAVSSLAYFRERRLVAEKETLAQQESQLRHRAEEIAVEKEELAAKNERLAEEANAEREKAVQLADEKTRVAEEKTEVSNFLITLFRTSDPLDFGGTGLRKNQEGDLTAHEILKRAQHRLVESKNAGVSKPIRAALLNTLGDVQRSRGEFDAAEKLLTEARTIGEEQFAADDPARSENLLNLGKLRHDQGRYHESEAYLRQALQLRESQRDFAPLEVAEVELQIARVLSATSRRPEAEQLLRKLLDTHVQFDSRDSLATEQVQLALMLVLLDQRKYQEAIQITLNKLSSHEVVQLYLEWDRSEQLRRDRKYAESVETLLAVIATAERALGNEHPLLVFMYLDLAGIFREKGDYHKSFQTSERAVKISESRLDDHSDFAPLVMQYAGELVARGDWKRAERLTRRGLQIAARPVNGARIHLITGDFQMTQILAAQGRYAEAEQVARQALVDSQRIWGDPAPDPRSYDIAIEKLCIILVDQGKFAEAEGLMRSRTVKVINAESEWHFFASILHEQGKEEEAKQFEAPYLAEIRSETQVHPGEGSAMAFRYRADILSLYSDHAAAESYFRRAVETARHEFPPQHPELGVNLLRWAECLIQTGQGKKAEAAVREALMIDDLAYQERTLGTVKIENLLAEVLWISGQAEEARRIAQEAFERRKELLEAEHPWRIDAHADYAKLLKLFGDLTAAESHYRTAVEMAAKILPAAHPVRWKTVPALANVLIAAGKPAEAKELLTTYLAETTPLLPEKSPRLAELRERIAKMP